MYITIAELQAYFEPTEILQLSNLHEPTATTVNATKVNQAIQWAEGVADSYLAATYQLPLASTPKALASRVADIARYGLDSVNPRPDVRLRYEDAIKWLQEIAAGKASLGSGFALLVTPPPSAIKGQVGIISPATLLIGEGLSGF